MNNKFYVYVHSRKSNGIPFYVGKGHGWRAYSQANRNSSWRAAVSADGGFTASVVALDLDEELAFLVECELIDRYRRLGMVLVNRTNGGEGPSGMKHSEATKAKFRERRFSDEVKKRMSLLRKGRPRTTPLSEKTKAALLAARLGKPSPRRGVPHSAETKEKMRKAWEVRRLTPESAETRAKKAAAHKGRKRSPETCARISAAKLGLRLKPEVREARRVRMEVRAS